MKQIPFYLIAASLFVTVFGLPPQAEAAEIKSSQAQSVFQIVEHNASVPIFFDPDAAPVIGIAANALADDISRITGTRPDLQNREPAHVPNAIIIGTLGQSGLIHELAMQGKIQREAIEGKWESFLIQIVDQPLCGMDKALVIAGSDPRGTAFGVFELSKLMGVSPWVYWADVIPVPKENLTITLDKILMGPPSVKYRGIFLNDEDWGLQPWAAQNMDTDIQDIGPKTYARIFELMLRLKANYIWPAMHPCTKAFFHYKENAAVAAQYEIVLGSSHCEPMLRNNVDEWKNNFSHEYGKEPGPWRYDTNPTEIERYWEDRVIESKANDAVYTVGMRGIHDGGMPGPKNTEAKVELLSQVIADQRVLLAKHHGRPASEIPQIFCPYKEVLKLYQAGATIPEDVTILWADDNHGYIRKLSTPDEQLRKGASGVYYHLSYWGAPADYLWLCSTAPALISYEMSKAHAYGADRLWVFNVGDIKPAEMEMEFALDLAWDVDRWAPERAESYIENWAARTFGNAYAAPISEIKSAYYQLAAAGKPEHVDHLELSETEIKDRLHAYEQLSQKARALEASIPERLQDAYFQLVLYPVLGAAKMNEKHFYAQLAWQHRESEQPYAAQSKGAFEAIKSLTHRYNTEIANGKWDRIMSMRPRKRPVFNMPALPDSTSPARTQRLDGTPPIQVISMDAWPLENDQLQHIPGLGLDKLSLSRSDFSGPSYDRSEASQAPRTTIKLHLPKGQRKIELRCIPTHTIHEGRGLRAAIRLNDESYQVLDFHAASKTPTWKKNVLRGFSSAGADFELEADTEVTLHLSLLDPGLAISQILVY